MTIIKKETNIFKILKRPKNGAPFLILVVVYPSTEYNLPALSKKELKDILVTIWTLIIIFYMDSTI